MYDSGNHPFATLVGLLILCPQLLFAQSDTKAISKQLDRIESYLYHKPDSAKMNLLRLLKDNPDAPDSSRGNIFHFLSVSMGILNQLDSGILVNRQAISLLSRNPDQLAFSYKNISILYRLKGEWTLAEKFILKGLQLNDSLINDTIYKAILLGEYASIRLDQKDPYRATELLLQALELCRLPKSKDQDTETMLRSKLANAYKATGNYTMCIREYKLLLSGPSFSDNEFGYIMAGLHLSDAFIHQKQFGSADSLLGRLDYRTSVLGNDELLSYLRMKQGLSHASRQDYRGSLPYYREAFAILEKNQSYYALECATLCLEALTKTGGFDEANRILRSGVVKSALEKATSEERLSYEKAALPFLRRTLSPTELNSRLEDMLQLTDSVNAANIRRSAMELQAKYQFDQQQQAEQLLKKENELLKQKERYNTNQMSFISAILSLLVVVMILVIVRHRQRTLLQKKELDSRQKEIQFQREKNDWIEREQMYRDQLIEEQKAELVRSLAIAEETKEKLEELVREKEEDRRKEILIQIEKSKEEKSGVEAMMSRFNAVYPNFTTNIIRKYPQLSRSDVQFCALFRMNLTTKEISAILHIEPRSLYNKKYRIMEKMGLGEGDDFEQVILNIN